MTIVTWVIIQLVISNVEPGMHLRRSNFLYHVSMVGGNYQDECKSGCSCGGGSSSNISWSEKNIRHRESFFKKNMANSWNQKYEMISKLKLYNYG